MLNTHGAAAVGDGDGTGVESGAGDATDGLGRWLDALRGHRDVQGTRNGPDTTADMMETISACRDTAKLPNSPVQPGKWLTNSRVEFRSCTGTPNMHRRTQHCSTREYRWRYTGNHQHTPEVPKPPDILTRSPAWHAEGMHTCAKRCQCLRNDWKTCQ